MTGRLVWEKELSLTDAQQRTRGSRIRFLRLTKGDNGVPHRTWFRDEFFAGLDWRAGESHGQEADVAEVTMHTIIDGEDMGWQTMRLTHRVERAEAHSSPPTQLRYSLPILSRLEAQDFTGEMVRLTRESGEYRFEIL